MGTDYIKNKVDFYSEYEKNYEFFFNDEVDPSNQSLISNNVSELQRKVRNVRKAFQNIQQSLQTDWQDPYGLNFSNYITSCDEYLDNVESSISSDFKSAEDYYKKLNDLLKNLEKQNKAYQDKWDTKPNQMDSKYTINVDAYTDPITGVFHQAYTYQNGTQYLSDYHKWEDDVSTLAGECINTIAEIEPLRTKLMEINGNPVNGVESGIASSSDAPVFEFDGSLLLPQELTGTVEEYIEANGLEYVKVNMWGEEFYVLAPIKKTRTQEDNECLSYARANAIALSEYNGYEVPLQGGNKNGCVYTSTDPNEIYKIALLEYLNGRSVALEVNGLKSKNTRHFVTLWGFEAGTDLSNVKPSNAIILDSTSTSTVGCKQLNTNNGGQMRYLKSASEMVNNSFGTDYTVIVYSDVDYSEMFPNTQIAPIKPYGASQSHKGDGAITFADA